MRSMRVAEFSVGILMIIGVVAFVFLAIQVSGLSTTTSSDAYFVTAKFNNIGGLKVNAPIRMAGVKVGKVTSITLDPKTFQADVRMAIYKEDNNIPADSSASILTEGLLGANYIGITPGYDEIALKSGSVIEDTHPALVLENLIGQLLFSINKKPASAKAATAAPAAKATAATVTPVAATPAAAATVTPVAATPAATPAAAATVTPVAATPAAAATVTPAATTQAAKKAS